MWTVILAYLLISYFSKNLRQTSLIVRFLTYVSTRSYTIFFVHILVLYVLDAGFPRRPFNYLVFSILVFVPTYLISKLIDQTKNKISITNWSRFK